MTALCRLVHRTLLVLPPGGRRTSCRAPTGRRDASAASSSGTSLVNLTYDVFDGKGESSTPLVFLHGLFGSKSNFHSIAKSLVQRTGRKPALVERLVVVDISPAQSNTRTNFHAYIRAMQDVQIPGDLPRSTARRMAEDQLRRQVKEHSVRQFLLTNLVEHNGRYAWRVNLDAISAHLDDIMSFPSFDSAYQGPALFLGGASSAYISSEDYPEIERLFPCADIQYIPDASHWIHADKPLDFISSIISFLQS
ncbi:protein ABHD11 isoform X2 [Phyllopteryx taeniolatus]|uniref:protein ABHD11 isoform X2 n=1 Tax=Phyllopteryx taeniolatus TaxID=161469 RepID=UPI002AD3DEBC|nr:protein ABHD11 isoform X2 [Phyllopteryx taeniolatus]